MSALVGDYLGNTVLIYDSDGNHLSSSVINEHDRVAKQIQLESMPYELTVNDECRLLILASPTPVEFNGKVKEAAAVLL